VAKIIDPPEIRHKIGLTAPEISVAVEALDELLVELGILKPGELIARAKELAKYKVLPGGDG